jgi:AcrR family transcriptional regulator
VTAPPGRRERKKAATRQNIVDTALRLFFERGYDDVGIRDIAAEADVAVTTVFAHFASKEALVFELDEDFERQLVGAVTDRAPDEPLVVAVRRAIAAQLAHCATPQAAPLWRMIDETSALRDHERAMRQRHAESLARAIADDQGLSETTTAGRALARFAVEAFSIAREADDPGAALEELFGMIGAAWEATGRQ